MVRPEGALVASALLAEFPDLAQAVLAGMGSREAVDPMTARKVMTPTQRKKAAKASAHGSRIKKVYGITREEYALMLETQQGRCAICNGKRPYRLLVDHCHRTGEVRGLLCKLCNNRLLPAAGDNVAILTAAIDYLSLPPARLALGAPRFVPLPETAVTP